MGFHEIARNQDYKAMRAGVAGIRTDVTDGLQFLHALHIDTARASRNIADDLVSGGVVGAPTFTDIGMSGNQSNYFTTNEPPSNNEGAFACVWKMISGSATTELPMGSYPAASLDSTGSAYLRMSGTNITFDVLGYTMASAPLSAGSLVRASMPKPNGIQYELFFGTWKSGEHVQIYHPRTRTLVTTATTRNIVFNAPRSIECPLSQTGTIYSNIALAGHWDREPSKAEMNQFYKDVAPGLRPYGVVI